SAFMFRPGSAYLMPAPTNAISVARARNTHLVGPAPPMNVHSATPIQLSSSPGIPGMMTPTTPAATMRPHTMVTPRCAADNTRGGAFPLWRWPPSLVATSVYASWEPHHLAGAYRSPFAFAEDPGRTDAVHGELLGAADQCGVLVDADQADAGRSLQERP